MNNKVSNLKTRIILSLFIILLFYFPLKSFADFENEDLNSDGKISKDEFKGPAHVFMKLDSNKDGILSKEKFQKWKRPKPIKEIKSHNKLVLENKLNVTTNNTEKTFHGTTLFADYTDSRNIRSVQPPPLSCCRYCILRLVLKSGFPKPGFSQIWDRFESCRVFLRLPFIFH